MNSMKRVSSNVIKFYIQNGSEELEIECKKVFLTSGPNIILCRLFFFFFHQSYHDFLFDNANVSSCSAFNQNYDANMTRQTILAKRCHKKINLPLRSSSSKCLMLQNKKQSEIYPPNPFFTFLLYSYIFLFSILN